MRITNLKGTTKLYNGVEIPYLGLGVFRMKDGKEVEDAVTWALDAGYRHIDTAAIYRNETGVGNAIRNSSLRRSEVFLTSKLWNTDQGYDNTKKALDESLKRLQTDYLDLYLIHWPVEGMYTDSWKAMEDMYDEGKVRAIGVSNFKQHHLENLLDFVRIKPMVDQMEFHPYLVQQDLVDFCGANDIQYEAWSPLMQGNIVDVPVVKEVANKYSKTPTQVAIRWGLQKGIVMIPKSSRNERIMENADVFDFIIEEGDMRRLDNLDRDKRYGPDPDTFEF
ncbi:MAG: aldo/keto reductase [Bacteroidales bacterium]|nr:aldo/keto reductase [Bacteroidales bacterium]MCF8333558.1 aldo/keto reductase [Bacteroidales bacterium]